MIGYNMDAFLFYVSATKKCKYSKIFFFNMFYNLKYNQYLIKNNMNINFCSACNLSV